MTPEQIANIKSRHEALGWTCDTDNAARIGFVKDGVTKDYYKYDGSCLIKGNLEINLRQPSQPEDVLHKQLPHL